MNSAVPCLCVSESSCDVTVVGGYQSIPDNSRLAVVTGMRLLVVDFPTAEADIVLPYLNRLTLANERIVREILVPKVLISADCLHVTTMIRLQRGDYKPDLV